MEEMIVERLVTEAVPKIVDMVRERIEEIEASRPVPPKLINAATAAEMCGIKPGTWYDLVKDGHAPKPVALSPTLNRWDADEVRAFIARRKGDL